jgi:hypothetical protein
MADYELRENGVLRRSDEMHIPDAPGNRDWRRYQAWLAEGNTPDPIPTKPVIVPADQVKAAIAADPALAAFARKLAKDGGVTEQEMIDGIAAEAKIQAMEV